MSSRVSMIRNDLPEIAGLQDMEDEGTPRVLVDTSGTERMVLPSWPGYGANAACVGSGTAMYGAMVWRFHPLDFRMKPTDSCPGCHEKHSQNTRPSCADCHPRLSNCGIDVGKMDTTFVNPSSKHNIHWEQGIDCHPAGIPKKKTEPTASIAQ